MKYLDLVPGTQVIYTVRFDSEDPTFSDEFIQKWLLESVPGGTKVTIICEEVAYGIRKEDHDIGLKSTLKILLSLLNDKVKR